MYLVFALTLAAVFAEGVGLLMLLPLLQGLDTGAAASTEPATGIGKLLHDLLAGFGWADSTVAIILLITVAYIAKGVLLFGANAFNALLRAQFLPRPAMRSLRVPRKGIREDFHNLSALRNEGHEWNQGKVPIRRGLLHDDDESL
ncbi:hypothetical protein [Lamprocystis purpurea]|jgi:hypothetical protein|uniref:hypothetical protein n=1 Tax=Lamprocystis purpurea TaxID=61598 RepID=UPI0003704E9F|nr:hypothetical protein [Lamprocystis purpurea]